MIFCFTDVSKINCKVWRKRFFLCWYLHMLMEFYEDILFHIIVVAQNCIEKYLLCETSCTSVFFKLSFIIIFFLLKQYTVHLYVYVWDIFWKKYQAKYIPAIQRQTFSRYIEICHLEYVCILCIDLKVFQSDIQETFKFNVDDIYFWQDS